MNRFARQFQPIINFDSLRHYPPETLGKIWIDTFDNYNLKPFSFGSRRLQLHDGIHVLLGYGVDIIDEARVQAFLLGVENKTKPLNATLLGLSTLKILKKLKEKGLNNPKSYQIIFQSLKQAYERGQNSTFNPDTWQPENMLDQPIVEIRKYFHL